MKKMNKKGFTIVELVIVIAVIAILAGVLIPTFSGVVQKANSSAALQKATSVMKSTLAMSDYGTMENGTQFVIVQNGAVAYKFVYDNNKIQTVKKETAVLAGFNTVILFRESNAGSKLTEAEANMINAATGLNLAKNTLLTANTGNTGYTVKIDSNNRGQSDPFGIVTTSEGGTETTNEATLNIFTNSDYAKDVITVTKSK